MREWSLASLVLAALLVLGASRVSGDDPPPSAPAGTEPKPARAPTPEQAAEGVLAAWKGKDDAALKALALRDDPDPWLVADDLIRRGEHDAAAAFARAAPRVDVDGLPAYVATQRGRPDDLARRERLSGASTALGARNPQEALTALGDAEPGPIDDVVGVRLAMGRGIALAGLARLEASAAAFLAAGDAAERVGWVARAFRAYAESSNVAYRGSMFGAELHALERTLSVCERRGDKLGAAVTLGNIGLVHGALGDYAKALVIHERALAAKEALGDKAGAAGTLGNIGHVHSVLGDYAKALAIHERALAAKEALGDKAGAALTLGNIGNVHLVLGDYAKALATLERARAGEEALGDKAGAVVTLGNIGLVHGALGDYAKALAIFERTLAAKEELGDKAGAALTLGNIGGVHFELGDYKKALAIHERALAAKEALGDRAGAAGTLGNIGGVHFALGDYAKALAIYERALTAQEALGVKAGAATTLANIGSVHEALGDHAEALATYERALAAQEALGDRAGAVGTLGNIGLAHRRLGDLKAARGALERAVRAARSLRAVPVLVRHLRGLAEVHLASGASGRALAAAREALLASETLLGGLGEEEGALARATHARLYEVGALAAVRDEDAAEACAFLEGGRAGALLDALDKREVLRWKAETLPEDLKAADRKALADERIARQAYERVMKGEDRKARAAALRGLDDALEEVRAVNARIQRETKRAAGLFYFRAKTLEDIQASLEPGEALVLFGLCLEEALALVVRPDGERIVPLGATRDVRAACDALDLRKPDGDPSEALAGLRRLLVDPLSLDEEVRHLLVSPEGPLCFLPWGALFDRPVAVTPSGTTHVILRDEAREPGVGVLALGDPDYAGASAGAQAVYYRGRTLAPLPATRGEVEALATVALLGAEASEDGLRAALPRQKRWRAVHLACHGLIDVRRPGLSSLALTRAGDDDGFLTALEVLRMQVPADLAVLSACETAMGKLEGGEGIVGLTRAFMYAGTPRVLCSLWKVDDEATATLMTKFYELWNPKDGTPGLPTAEALRQAQEVVRSQEKWKHPYYWAAWVLWGLPD